MFKDMAEEYMSTGIAEQEISAGVPSWDRTGIYKRIRDLAHSKRPEEIQEYVLKHAEHYMSITGRPGNWAGSSEMLALASAFGRSIEAYGNNWISQDAVYVEKSGTVQPYLNAKVQES